MPKGKLIYGPLQVEAKIDQDPEISKEFTLWNNSGSKYSRGEMFVIPIEDSLIYVEPVYLESSTASLPEVKRVIVYYDEELAYEATLAQALDKLFGKGAGDPLLTPYPIITGMEMADEIERKEQEEQNPPEPVDPTPVDPDQPGEHTVEELIQMAQQAYDKAQEAMKNLDWAAYGQYMQQLSDILTQLAGYKGE